MVDDGGRAGRKRGRKGGEGEERKRSIKGSRELVDDEGGRGRGGKEEVKEGE